MTEFFVALLLLCGPDAGAGAGCRFNAMVAPDRAACELLLGAMGEAMTGQPGEEYSVVRRECVPVAIAGESGA